jgi:hypothetical protein
MSVQELTGRRLTISAAKALRRFAKGRFAETGITHRNDRSEPGLVAHHRRGLTRTRHGFGTPPPQPRNRTLLGCSKHCVPMS